MATVERKIYFYRADVDTNHAGRPTPFHLAPALRYINQLRYSATAGRYLDHGDARLCCWIDRIEQQSHFRFGRIRRSGFPMVEQAGSLSELSIPPNSGLVEAIHVVTFGGNIVGSDFNFYGPRMSALSTYLKERGNGLCPEVQFEQLLRRDAEEKLRQFEELRLFQLKIRPSYIRVLEEANADLAAAFTSALTAGQAEEMELILRPARSLRFRLARDLLDTARFLTRRRETQSDVSKFSVAGINQDTGRVEHLDIMHDQLVVRKRIVRQTTRGRALESMSAYRAIEEAYREVEPEVAAATGVVW